MIRFYDFTKLKPLVRPSQSEEHHHREAESSRSQLFWVFHEAFINGGLEHLAVRAKTKGGGGGIAL